jgi:hypothetical protein
LLLAGAVEVAMLDHKLLVVEAELADYYRDTPVLY